MPTRRQFLQGAAALTVASLTRSIFEAGPASADPLGWALPASAYANLANPALGGDAGLCARAFGGGSTWFVAPPTASRAVPVGLTGVAVADFTAYADGSGGLEDLVRAGRLPAWAQAVRYDPEAWAATPEVEQGAWLYNADAGASYAELFAHLAQSRGLRVILTPGTDLCNNLANPAYPNDSPQYPLEGRSEAQAFIGYGMAAAARWLGGTDIFEFQSQSLEASPANGGSTTTLASTVAQVASQARSASTAAFFAGIGRTGKNWDGATAADLHDSIVAAASSGAVGCWLNVDADSTRVTAMIGALRLLGF